MCERRRLPKRIIAIGDDSTSYRFSSSALDHCTQCVRIYIPHLSSADFNVGWNDFVASGKDTDSWLAGDTDFGNTKCHEAADFLRSQPLPGLNNNITLFNILTHLKDILPNRHWFKDFNLSISCDLGIFKHHNRI